MRILRTVNYSEPGLSLAGADFKVFPLHYWSVAIVSCLRAVTQQAARTRCQRWRSRC